MATKVMFQKSGMGIEEGTVVRWLKAVGDRVQKDDLIVEIETAKALQEVLAPVSGVLSEILLKEGETGEVNTTIALIEEERG